MSKLEKLKALRAIAQMVQDADMARLQKLASARNATREKLDELARPVPLVEDPALFAARQAHLKWATVQRIQMNQTLAQQTARVLQQREVTARSHGRCEALGKIDAQERARLSRKQRP